MTGLGKRLGIYGIVAVVIVGITLLVIAGYRLYNQNFADTPEKAVRAYLDTLNKGDMLKLYDMTRGASGQTQAEFAVMVSGIMKDQRVTTDPTALASIGRQGGVYYYRITGHVKASDGSYRLAPLILEAAQEGSAWRVSVYLPPAAYPAGQ